MSLPTLAWWCVSNWKVRSEVRRGDEKRVGSVWVFIGERTVSWFMHLFSADAFFPIL